MKKNRKYSKNLHEQTKERMTSMFYNVMPSGYGRQYVQSTYTRTQTRECSRMFMTSDAFRVMLRSMATGCKGGDFRQEDAVELYGFRTKEKDGTIAAVVTDVVESSPAAKRSGCTFDVDNNYSLHRDKYIRDRHTNPNFTLVGYIHSHPGHMTHFSQQDIETMAMYAPEMKVFLSGLVTLYNGNLECTMYVCTWENGRLLIWDVPLLVSDEEAQKRLPHEKKKDYSAIWQEATGSGRVPRLCMLETSMDAMMACGNPKREEATKPRYNIDVSGIPEGTEGLLCGMMVNGRLSLFLKPMVQQPDGEAALTHGDKVILAEEPAGKEKPADEPAEAVQEQQPVQRSEAAEEPGEDAFPSEAAEESTADAAC